MVRVGIAYAGVLVYVDARFHCGCGISHVMLLLHEVQNREKENPDEVDEVPVKAGDLDPVGVALRLVRPHLCTRPGEIEKYDHASENVQTVEAGEREVDREEIVRLGKAALLKLVAVFESFGGEKDQ